MHRLTAFAIFFSVTLFSQSLAFHRDWKKYPAIAQLDTKSDIYAIGDVHADPARLAALLVGAKIIAAVPQQPSDISWTARDSVVVFTGDMIDKGPDSMAAIALIRALQTEAAKDGGQVIVTMGNHEAEFLATPASQKAADFARELKISGQTPADVAACKGDLGGFLCNLPFGVRVNDWFFSHGGNTAGRTLPKLISDLQDGVDTNGFQSQALLDPNSLLEARLVESPWFQPKGASAEATLTAYCHALGVKHIVQGHQPSKVIFADGVKRATGEMFQRYGLIFLEDTGMSEGIDDSHGAALLISHDNNSATAICFNGTATVIWDNQTHHDLGRIPPCVGQ